jgi:CRISPR-associated endonuclease Cas2
MRPRIKIGEKILEILATAGVVGFAALCEGMKSARWSAGGYTDYRVKRSLSRLKNRDLIVKIKTPAGPKWQLTPAGKKLFDQKNLLKIKLDKPAVWDGRWRLVIFDIPQQVGRHSRDIFRRKLNDLGFKMLQRSVFISPWPGAEAVSELARLLELENYVRIFEVKFLSADQEFKKHFGLS